MRNLQTSKRLLIRWGISFLDIGLIVFVLWYNPLSDRLIDSVFEWLSRYGISIYREGVVVVFWVWSIILAGLGAGITLLVLSIFGRSGKWPLFVPKGQLLLTTGLFVATALVCLSLLLR